MTVKIRLARGGAKKRPFYRIVVASVDSPRDGKFLEKIGTYNPMLAADSKDRVKISLERADHWVQHGAQPTDRVINFLLSAGVKLPARIMAKFEIKKKNRTTKPSKKSLKEEAAA